MPYHFTTHLIYFKNGPVKPCMSKTGASNPTKKTKKVQQFFSSYLNKNKDKGYRVQIEHLQFT